MDKIEKIRQEIERHRQAIRVLNEHTEPEQTSKTCAIFQYSDTILSGLLSFIDTLQEPLTLTTPEKDVPHFIPFQDTRPFCYEPGGHCTNPQMDCINCSKHNSTIPYVYTGPHIDTYISGDAKGTSEAELSATDGKEHNPSFIE